MMHSRASIEPSTLRLELRLLFHGSPDAELLRGYDDAAQTHRCVQILDWSFRVLSIQLPGCNGSHFLEAHIVLYIHMRDWLLWRASSDSPKVFSIG